MSASHIYETPLHIQIGRLFFRMEQVG
jgi:hypothetical protein